MRGRCSPAELRPGRSRRPDSNRRLQGANDVGISGRGEPRLADEGQRCGPPEGRERQRRGRRKRATAKRTRSRSERQRSEQPPSRQGGQRARQREREPQGPQRPVAGAGGASEASAAVVGRGAPLALCPMGGGPAFRPSRRKSGPTGLAPANGLGHSQAPRRLRLRSTETGVPRAGVAPAPPGFHPGARLSSCRGSATTSEGETELPRESNPRTYSSEPCTPTCIRRVAPPEGVEPSHPRLTAGCSAVEPRRRSDLGAPATRP